MRLFLFLFGSGVARFSQSVRSLSVSTSTRAKLKLISLKNFLKESSSLCISCESNPRLAANFRSVRTTPPKSDKNLYCHYFSKYIHNHRLLHDFHHRRMSFSCSKAASRFSE